MSELTIEVRDEPSVVAVEMRGSLDLQAYETVRVTLVERLRADPRDIVLELDGVDYVDSTGLRLLVEVAALASRDRRRCVIVMAARASRRRAFSLRKTHLLIENRAGGASARAALP